MSSDFRLNWGLFGRRKLPVFRQSSIAECGLVSLAMIVNYWGWRIDLGTLRTRMPPSLKGTNLKAIIRLAADHGLDSRAVRAHAVRDLRKLQLPALLHIKGDHFVVLASTSAKGATVHDPAAGRVFMSWDRLADQSAGIAVEFTPTGSFLVRDERRTLGLRSILSHLSGGGIAVVQIFILSVLLQVVAVVAPLYIQLVVDEAVTRLDVDLLNVLLAGFSGLAVIGGASFFLRRILTLKVGQLLARGLMSNLFRHMLKLPSGFFEQRHLGDVTSRFNSTMAIQAFLTGPALDAVVDTVAALISFFVLFLYGSLFALVSMVIVLAEGGLYFGTIWIRRLLTEDKLATESREETHFLETIRAIRSIKLFGRERERLDRWQSRLGDMTGANYRLGAADAAIRASGDLIGSVGAAVIIFITARAAINGSITIGMMMSFIAYQVYFGRASKNAVDAIVSWRTLTVHLDRISDLALAPEEDRSGMARPEMSGAIELAAVSFRYHSDETSIIRDLSLSVKQGEMVAITGRSGEGKTTLLKLLLALERPLSGEVRYDGIALSRIERAHFVSKIATVMQDDTLLSGTIAENISFFDTEPDMAKVEECARTACIHDDIAMMPMRYASLIGDMGSALSGGQKQRIMIARALYHEPKILFMDEGTSHLDLQVERQINDNLAKLNITRIVIAHRPDTLRICDRIYELKNGGLEVLPPESGKSPPLS